MTIKFIPTTLDDDVRFATVTEIWVCAHDDAFELEYDPNNTSPEKVNHWAMYAQIEGCSTKSVKLDMSVGDGPGVTNPDAPVGILEISTLDRSVSERVVRYNVVKCSDSVTVDGLLSTVTQSGYDKYDFHESCIGCRYWTQRALELFQDKGLIEPESAAIAIDGIAQAWNEDGSEHVPAIPIRAGTFHSGK